MAKKFNPTVGSRVTKKDALSWIDKYDNDMRPDKKKDTKSMFYGRDALLKLLAEEGSAGITFFLALKYNEVFKKDTVQLVLVSTTEDGTLLWGDDNAKAGGGGAGTYDNNLPCPPYCPK
ncbi:MAG: hypothetical protein ABIS36_16640 [Chryseolinea sp.]